MLSVRGRFADVYATKIDTGDFQDLMRTGLGSDLFYDRLDEMDMLVGGIASHDFHLWINDEPAVESLSQLHDRFVVSRRGDIDLRLFVDGDQHTFSVVEYSKIRSEDDSIVTLQSEDLSFETQRVIFNDDCELTLIFPFYKKSFVDVSEEIEFEAFTGMLISKEYGFKQFDIE
jgi:hypothetical protein